MPRTASTGVYAAAASTWNPAVSGTVISSTVWNALLADLTAVLSTESATTRAMWPLTSQVQDGGFIWGGTSGGSANAHTITLTPAVTALGAGRQIEFIAGYTNTGAATLAVNAIAATALRKMTAAGLVALTGGEIVAGNRIRVTDNGTYYILADKPELTKGADVASATTTDLGAATGEFVDVTGTTTITGLGTIAAGVKRTVRFTGILTLTYNATSLILPSAATITTAAGDRAEFISLGSGNWLCTNYTRASGAALVFASSIDQGLHTINLEGRAFTPRTTNGAGTYSAETTTNDVMIVGLAFDQTTSEGAQARFVMPQSWNAGTITARLRWTAASGSGTVMWGVQAVALRNNVAIDTAFGTAVTVTDTLLTANYEHVTDTTAAITIGNSPAKADTIILQVYRNISDTLNADAVLLSVEVFYTINAATDA